MNFLFDENMPVRLAKGLEILDADNDLGKPPAHKFFHITQFKKRGAEDPVLVRIAKISC